MELSVILITFNRCEELVENIQRLLPYQNELKEIIIIDNNSTDQTPQVLSDLATQYPIIKPIKSSENLGVSGGRNLGIQKASGDIFIFLDDDAILTGERPFQHIIKLFTSYPDLGVTAFQIINFYSRQIKKHEFPALTKKQSPLYPFWTSYFIGAGFAVRKNVISQTGTFPAHFFYGMEELDLSFRVINQGFRILYTPQVIVYHKQSPKARLAENKKWRWVLSNKLEVNAKYLPIHLRMINNFVWMTKIFLHTKSLFFVIQTYLEFLQDPIRQNSIKTMKTPLKKTSYEYMARHHGRLLY